jgi:hypothetical protein
MAKNAVFILEDHDRLTMFKENALAQAKRFDILKVVNEYEDYYKLVIERSLHTEKH